MVKHIVMWRLKDEAEGATREENLKKMTTRLNTLPDSVDEIVDFEVGGNFNPADAAFDVALYSSFKDRAALDIYQNHPKHLEVAGFVRKVAAERAVVDYEI